MCSNRVVGQRSSSLHYAACFGRPAIAKVLLRFGANPDLRDEDGKTALDKARERNEEGHREVADILQSPSDWIVMLSHSTSGIESVSHATGISGGIDTGTSGVPKASSSKDASSGLSAVSFLFVISLYNGEYWKCQ